ncbi:5-histidylcysteine sulfoxide synthase [Sulfurimonas sp. HSL-1716]|uniref:5-histidylcysteine sulfoxide synthase n=1 Tax=Hydrocurvibacter sulfurireducens TaxID=3131937 RepID=UPI0031F9BCC5
MNRYYSYPPTLTDDGDKREEIRRYFHNSYDMFEKVFDLLKDESVFYRQSEPSRHPMIFYFGHTAAFFINKLVIAGIIKERINPEFESIFAIGVDEMVWDDLDEEHYRWPKVSEVRQYRDKVREVVDALITDLPLTLPIKWEDPFWIILMGIEHERIHIETSSVLHRQMPIEFIKEVKEFDIFDDGREDFPLNAMVDIKGAALRLGKDFNHHLYGWDNEYGTFMCGVDDFKVSKFLVSNGEFLEFVKSGGYEDETLWDEEGLKFLQIRGAKYPPFWVKTETGFKYRTISRIVDMPKNWPVDVNALEAQAYCRYISRRDGITYSLPSEAQWYRLYEHAGLKDVPSFDDKNANINLSHHLSSCSVDRFSFNGVYDVVGNVWQWTDTPIDGFSGFKIHNAYDDFSTPTFDGKHNLIKGGSFISTGNEIMKHARYAFRRHFYQHAGFRYVVNSMQNDEKKTDIYESDELVSQYCEFQYGDEYFGVENFALACVKQASAYIKNRTKALDLGCATGRSSFELAAYFDEVEGVDFSARFISVATRLKEEGYIAYRSKEEGDLYSLKRTTLKELGYENVKDKVSFWQGDACNLKPNLNSYDLIMATNLIDRLYDPGLFLQTIGTRLNKDGLLILTSPYTWQESSTAKELWLGGYKDGFGNEIRTIDNLKKILAEKFEFIDMREIPFVIKETARKYQHTISQMSVWKKR